MLFKNSLLLSIFCLSCLPGILQGAVVADFHFDESGWAGISDEILDSAASGYHGEGFNGATTSADGIVCRGGDFSATGTDYARIDANALDGLSDFSVSVWAKTTSNNSYQTILSGANRQLANELLLLMAPTPDFYPGISIRYFSDATEISTATFNDNSWHHFVWTRTTATNSSCFYLDGVLQGCSNHASTDDDDPLDIDAGGLVIGQDQDSIGGGFDASQAWNGLLDELLIFDTDLPAGDVGQIYTNQLAGNEWDGTTRVCGADIPIAAHAEYYFDENTWVGTPNEVLDSSSSGYHGEAYDGATTIADGVVCRAGDFSATSANYVSLDAAALDGLRDFTISVWAKTSSNNSYQTIVSGANSSLANEVILLMDSAPQFHPGISIQYFSEATEISTSTFNNDSWHHFAWTRTTATNSSCFYMDSVLQGCSTHASADDDDPLNVDTGGFVIGQDQDSVGGGFQSSQAWQGSLDELLIFPDDLALAGIQQIYTNQAAGNNWDGSSRNCDLNLRGEYHFDENSWSGVADEVEDSSGNDYHGVAFNADTTDGKVCRAADLSSVGDEDYLSIDNALLDGVGDFSMSLWIKSANPDNKAVISGANSSQANELILWAPYTVRFNPYLQGQTANISVPSIWDNQWHHVVWTRSGTANCFYIDNASVGCGSVATGNLDIANGGLVIGQEQDSVGGGFVASQAMEGLLDEFVVFADVLSSGQISDIYNNNDNGLNWDGTAISCPSFGASGLVVEHDWAGIHCAEESVRILAIDSGGAPVTSYAQQVTLTTSTNKGTWRLIAGGGYFNDATPGDGVALYTFAAADNGEAVFGFSYPEGNPGVDIDVVQTNDSGVSDGDTEGLLVFAPSGFSVTGSALSNPVPTTINSPVDTQTAGTDFAIHLTAYGTTPTDPVCGVIESYQGGKSLLAWQTLTDPSSGTILASINATSVGASQVAATTIATNFAAGQTVLTAKYKDVGRLRLHFNDQLTGPTAVQGETNDFVVRPADLRVVDVETVGGVDNPAATAMDGARFVIADSPFVVLVDALDAEGSRTPNYGRESSAEGIVLRSANLVLPTGGSNGIANDGVLGAATSFTAATPAGRFTNSSVTFDDIGIVQLQASIADGDYLGTGDVSGSVSGNVGRFYLNEYVLSVGSLTPSCSTFTYMDESGLSLDYNVQANNASGVQVTNYDGSLLGGDIATVLTVAEDNNDGNELSARISHTPGSWVNGAYAINVTDAQFDKLLTPDGGYESLSVGVKVVDNVDSRSLFSADMQADTNGDCSVAGTCDANSIGITQVYYGRLSVPGAIGPENLNLPIVAQTEIYQGAGFVPFTGDNCTPYQASDLSLSGFAGNLQAGETTSIAPLTVTTMLNGQTRTDLPPLLQAPGFGNDGSVVVEFSTPAWLQFPWLGGGVVNPSGVAEFGSYRGHDRIVYWAEDP